MLLKRFVFFLFILTAGQILTWDSPKVAALIFGSLIFSINTFLLLIAAYSRFFSGRKFFGRRSILFLAIFLKIINLLALIYVGLKFLEFDPLLVVIGAAVGLALNVVLMLLSSGQREVLLSK